MNQISKSAHIASSVKMGEGNIIGENVVISGNVTLGNNNKIGPNCFITNNVVIGDNNIFTGFASIGLEAEMGTKGDKLFPDKYVFIGNNNKIREFVTIHAPMRKEETRVGNHCYLMSRSHIGHDCLVGNKVVFSANTIIGGASIVEDSAFIGMGSVTHQWLRIGKCAMIGMNSVNTRSVIPFTTVAGSPSRVLSFNIIGAQRNGYEKDATTLENLSLEDVINSDKLIDENNEILKAIYNFCQENPNCNKKLR